MSLQRCVYVDDDLAQIIIDKKLPLSWFVNQALREYFNKIGFLKEILENERKVGSKS